VIDMILNAKISPSKAPSSWRDVLAVHPAADEFPMMGPDELRALGEDIKQNGLIHPIVLWAEDEASWERNAVYLLDGRNRLAAMEMVGLEIFRADKQYCLEVPHRQLFGVSESHSIIDGSSLQADPYEYTISANIHRRQITTKEEQADLIVRVLAKRTDLANVARSVKRDDTGHLAGSTKDPIKSAAIAQGAKHDISRRTMEGALARSKGRPQQPRRKPATKPNSDLKPASTEKSDPVGSSPIRNSELAATSVSPPITATAVRNPLPREPVGLADLAEHTGLRLRTRFSATSSSPPCEPTRMKL
jgi:hypothetical protein